PRRGRRDPLRRQIQLVTGVPRGHPLARGTEGFFPGRVEIRLEPRESESGLGGLSIGVLAGERAAAGFADRPFETGRELRDLPRRAILLSRKIAAFALRRGPPR